MYFSVYYSESVCFFLACDSNPCMNGGTCVQQQDGFICECLLGFNQPFCSKSIYVTDGLIYHWKDRQTDRHRTKQSVSFTEASMFSIADNCASNPCANGGACSSTPDGFTCTCPDGFTGADCSIDIDECESFPCRNGGGCTDLVNGFTCDCVSGFTGDLCQTDVQECDSSPCQNEGSCHDLTNGYVCECLLGFTGINCETSECLLL